MDRGILSRKFAIMVPHVLTGTRTRDAMTVGQCNYHLATTAPAAVSVIEGMLFRIFVVPSYLNVKHGKHLFAD